jgi:acyl-CoA reductase-like NAD-dependent aldehyde dehydrogenase
MRQLANIQLKEEIIDENAEKQIIVRYTPLGVAVGIVPWNFPIHLACGKIAPSLLTGNPIIIKPSPFTPYCDLKLGELAQKFFPPGVLQVLSGDDSLGPWLTSHPGIDKISFTGSTVTGRLVMASAAMSLKRVTLELQVHLKRLLFASLTELTKMYRGGNDPAIVTRNVDIPSTAEKVIDSNSHQYY